MAGKFHLADPLKKHKAQVRENGSVLVTNVPASPQLLSELGVDGGSRVQYFNGLLGANGVESTPSTTTDMSVDGSVTPQTFYVEASTDYNLIITAVVITIVGGSVSHSKFGDVNQLPTGWDLVLNEGGEDTYLVNKATTGGEVLVQTGIYDPFGGSSVNIISAFSGNNDAMIAKIPINNFMPDGIVITKGSTNKLTSVINDDLSGLVNFNVRVIGYRD